MDFRPPLVGGWAKKSLKTCSNHMNGPQDDLMHEDWKSWANTSESVFVSAFSAVCLLTARYMADVLGKDKVNWHRNQDLL